jgi:hypothetical protein
MAPCIGAPAFLFGRYDARGAADHDLFVKRSDSMS